jgi:hypothetical protein
MERLARKYQHPSSAGLSATTALRGRGWSVTIDSGVAPIDPTTVSGLVPIRCQFFSVSR